MLFVYTGVDQYLREAGRLGFVITQTVFKTTGAGDGFRRLRFEREKKQIVLKPLVVHDLSAMQVFEGATNRTAVFVCEKQRKDFTYPVPYVQWSGPSRIGQDATLKAVMEGTKQRKVAAVPIERTKSNSPWLTAQAKALVGIQKVLGKSHYTAFEGVNTGGLNGCFWIQIIEEKSDGSLIIENLHDVGKVKVDSVRAVVERDLVYPLLRGRDVSRWQANPSACIILAQDPKSGKGIQEAGMRKKFPETFAYLKKFEGSRQNPQRGTLRGRALYKQYFRPTDPFYSMYNVGPYTLATWKVMWPEVGHTVRAGVCGPLKVDSDKPALPDHTIVAVACETASESYFVCALLNSAPAQAAASGYIVLHPSPHILEHIAIPHFSPDIKIHALLGELAERCHDAARKEDTETVGELEVETDKAAAKLWGITDDELKAIQEALAETGKSKRVAKRSSDDVDEEELSPGL